MDRRVPFKARSRVPALRLRLPRRELLHVQRAHRSPRRGGRGCKGKRQMKFILAAILWSALASAHHSFAAEFDIAKPVRLEGTVTGMEWINPHAWIHIDVKGPDGTIT